MYTLREKVGWFAFSSRIFVIVTQVLSNAAIPDHHADAFVSPINPSDEVGVPDKTVSSLFGGFFHWDSEYFLHVARYGYTHENCLAFFPLYPLCVRWASALFILVFGNLLNPGSVHLITSIFINGVLFIWAALVLYDLSERIFGDKGMAYRSAILFCVSPASIFFVAPYSETLFALLSFKAMEEAENGVKGIVSSSIPFGLAAVTRSNGLANVGFAVHAEARHITDVAMNKGWQAAICRALCSSWTLLLGVCFMVAPFATFQGYATVKFCNPSLNIQSLPNFLSNYTTVNNLIVPGVGDPPAWCNSSSLVLPYTAVQSLYWDVGFLRYFHWKQIPNFLLATPMAVLIIYGSSCFFKQHKMLCYNIGLWRQNCHGKRKLFQRSLREAFSEDCKTSAQFIFPPGMFVYIAHASSLLIICFLFIHVQVTTRLIASASPVPYWFAAYFICPISIGRMCKEGSRPLVVPQLRESGLNLDIESADNLYSIWKVFAIFDIRKHSSFVRLSPREKIASQLTQLYFLSYSVIGIVLFCNNLPWT